MSERPLTFGVVSYFVVKNLMVVVSNGPPRANPNSKYEAYSHPPLMILETRYPHSRTRCRRETNTVFGVKDLSFHIDDDEHKTRTTHSVLVTNMTRHGWSKPLQPFTEPVSCLVFKGAKQVSAGWIVAIIWYQRKLNRQLGIYMKCTDFEVLVATDDNDDSLGISLKDYHFSAVREDLPLKPLPAEWKLLPKKEILSNLIEKGQ
eukprot:g38850.t1